MRTEYNLKAELYDKYRWEYPNEAIQWIIVKTKKDNNAIVADFGAGTGILTKQLSETFKKVYAIEPDDCMANFLSRKQLMNTLVIKKYAHEADEIQNGSIDMIFAAHAIHWFAYEKTIVQFRRILKDDGFMVVMENQFVEPVCFLKEINEITNKYQDNSIKSKNSENAKNDYFREYEEQQFDFFFQRDFEQYMNGLSSASFLPDRSSGDKYSAFKEEIEKVFKEYENDGSIKFSCQTKVRVGRIKRNST